MESLEEYGEGHDEETDAFDALAQAQAAAFSDESLYELTGTEASRRPADSHAASVRQF